MLSEKSVELHCSTKCPAAYTLISTPFNVFLSPTSNSDPNQVYMSCKFQLFKQLSTVFLGKGPKFEPIRIVKALSSRI